MNKFFLILFLIISFMACQESLEDRCAREAQTYTAKKCPAKIGENTIIDSLVFDRNTHTLHYYYTLTGTADNPNVFSLMDIRKVLLEELRNSTSVKAYKDNGYNFAYTYLSEKNKGTILFDVVFKEKDYR